MYHQDQKSILKNELSKTKLAVQVMWTCSANIPYAGFNPLRYQMTAT